jgi:hypothetical protein
MAQFLLLKKLPGTIQNKDSVRITLCSEEHLVSDEEN